MLDILMLCFTWLPAPLDMMAFGLFCLLALIVVIKVVAMLLDIIPFL